MNIVRTPILFYKNSSLNLYKKLFDSFQAPTLNKSNHLLGQKEYSNHPRLQPFQIDYKINLCKRSPKKVSNTLTVYKFFSSLLQ